MKDIHMTTPNTEAFAHIPLAKIVASLTNPRKSFDPTRLAELAEMDNSMLKDLLQELDTGAFDMELTGYRENEIEDLVNQFYVGPRTEPKRFSKAFLLTKEQTETVNQAIELAKLRINYNDSGKKTQGNALAKICEVFLKDNQ